MPGDRVIQWCEMQLMLTNDQENAADGDEAPPNTNSQSNVPLFKFVIGSCCSDPYALACAKLAGVEHDVLERARVVCALLRENVLPSSDARLDAGILQLLNEIRNHSGSWATASDKSVQDILRLAARAQEG